jgi:serine phosphatase RsbU (regulator of sigma subunit)
LFEAQPAAILALVNRVLCDQSGLAPVTLVCARVERRPQSAQITLASGGHPLPVLRRADGTLERLGFNDLLLGVIRDEHWDEHSSRLEPGDAVLFFTDGVTDTPGANERFGERRLMQVVEGADGSPAALLAATEAALRAFQQRDVSDDRALLALRFSGD